MNTYEIWSNHATKLLGTLATALGLLQAALGSISASPEFSLLVTPKQFAMLSVINVVLGGMTIKRGFTNTRNATQSTAAPENKP